MRLRGHTAICDWRKLTNLSFQLGHSEGSPNIKINKSKDKYRPLLNDAGFFWPWHLCTILSCSGFSRLRKKIVTYFQITRPYSLLSITGKTNSWLTRYVPSSMLSTHLLYAGRIAESDKREFRPSKFLCSQICWRLTNNFVKTFDRRKQQRKFDPNHLRLWEEKPTQNSRISLTSARERHKHTTIPSE